MAFPSPTVDRITLHHVRMQLATPFRAAHGSVVERECLLVEVDAGGLTGWGECVASAVPPLEAVAAGRAALYTYETLVTARHALVDFLIPRLLGRPASVAEVDAAGAALNGHPMARAALEAAVWDVVAQAEGVSLARALGATRDRVAVGVVIGLKPTLVELDAAVERAVVEGYRRVKVKVAPGEDVAPLTAIRARFPDLELWADANGSYSGAGPEAVTALDRFGLGLIEQPLAADDLVGHAELQRRLATPICLDESIGSLGAARAALALGAGQVLNIKPGRVGGLAEAVRIHNFCQTLGVPAWVGGMHETGIGRAANMALAALPGFTLPGDLSPGARTYVEDIAEPSFTLAADGTVAVPAGTGLGVTVDERRLAAVTLGREVFGG